MQIVNTWVKTNVPDNFETRHPLSKLKTAISRIAAERKKHLINHTLEHKHFPASMNKAKVILLPKDPQFNGDISRTRPISLLEPFRKLVGAVH
nr:hypothetical protein HK105_003184 [Polyrhizophydium stewartii]